MRQGALFRVGLELQDFSQGGLGALDPGGQHRYLTGEGAEAVMVRGSAPDTRRLRACSYLYVRARKYSYGWREAVSAALAHPFRGQGAAFAKTLQGMGGLVCLQSEGLEQVPPAQDLPLAGEIQDALVDLVRGERCLTLVANFLIEGMLTIC